MNFEEVKRKIIQTKFGGTQIIYVPIDSLNLAESEKEKKYDLAAIIDGNIHPCTIGGDASKIVYFWHHFDVTFDSVNRKWNEQKNVSDQQLPVSTFSDDYDVKG